MAILERGRESELIGKDIRGPGEKEERPRLADWVNKAREREKRLVLWTWTGRDETKTRFLSWF